MTFGLARKVFTVLVAVLVAAALSLSASYARDTPKMMATNSEMTETGPGDYHHCQNGEIGKPMGTNCEAMCAASFVATAPEVTYGAVADISAKLPLPDDEINVGSRSPPDPYPPRSLTIG